MNKPNKIDIAFDPDSKAHGVAMLVDGFFSIRMMTLIDVIDFLQDNQQATITCHIENVLKNSATFKKRGVRTAAAAKKVSKDVGLAALARHLSKPF